MNINQSCFRVPPHGSIRAGFKAGGIFTVSALEGELLSLHINPWNRMGFFVDGLNQFLGYRRNFHSTPELALMATCTFFLIDD